MNNLKEKEYLSEIYFQNLEIWSVQYLKGVNLLYNKKYDLVPIRDLIIQNKNPIFIEDEKKYKRVTIKMHGKGAILRDEVFGENIGTKKQFKVSKGDFIMSKIDARNGAFGIVPDDLDDAIITNSFLNFKVNEEKINIKFLVLLVSTSNFVSFIQSCSRGTTGRKNVDMELFLNSKIPLPSLLEQKRIVENYNQKIKESEEAEKKAEELEKNIEEYLMEELGIEKTEKEEKKKGLQEVNFKDLDRWNFDYLKSTSLVKDLMRGRYNNQKLRSFLISYQYGLSKKAFKEKIGVPMLRMNNIFNSELSYDNLKYVKLEKNDLEKYMLSFGDLLFNRTNSKELVGKTALFEEREIYVFASYLIRVKLNEDIANKYYINYIFNSELLQIQKNMISRQITGQANINAQEMQNFLFPLPPLQIQQKIVEKISGMKNEIKSLKKLSEENKKLAIVEFEGEIFSV